MINNNKQSNLLLKN